MKKYHYIILLVVACILCSCQEDEQVQIAKLNVDELFINPSYKTADVSWVVTSNATIQEVTIEYSTDSTFAQYEKSQMIAADPDKNDGKYKVSLSQLMDGSTYYVRCRAINKISSCAQRTGMFTTKRYTSPSVQTDSITNITTASATLCATLSDWGSETRPNVGFFWATHANVTENDVKEACNISTSSAVISFSHTLSNLTDGVTYYIRAYAQNTHGLSLSEECSFITGTPTVVTLTTTNITESSATCRGNVVADGGHSVTERGICHSISAQPTITDNKIVCGSGLGEYSCEISNLDNGKTYHVRAYAINDNGIVYGSENTFIVGTPTVRTVALSNISYTSASCSGSVEMDGGKSIITRGICYGETNNPTIEDYKVENGNGVGSFTCSMKNLKAGSTYHVRAFAENINGISYGEIIEFRTLSYSPPSVTTSPISKITESSATCGGNVISDGGDPVFGRGVCYGTSENPTISDNKIEKGQGEGAFSCEVTGLKEGTIYHYRAYAENRYGVSYGEDVMFATMSVFKDGVLPGVFSVSSTQKIHFSQGNLQYRASSGTWRFAENQWDYVGGYSNGSHGTVSGSDNRSISSTYSGWIDLFGWGTSGAYSIQPWTTTTDNSAYYKAGEYGSIGHLTNLTSRDWGIYNAISNGGQKAKLWRTPTSYEWTYIISTRENAKSLYGKATVNGVNGIILLPDNFHLPQGIEWVATEQDYETNNYNLATWVILEQAGAVFLPSAGYRGEYAGSSETKSYSSGGGYYWSATCGSNYTKEASALYWFWGNSHVSVGGGTNVNEYHYGHSVRLIQNAK